MPMPPMWEIGHAIGYTSPSPKSMCSVTPRLAPISVRSLCCTPLGNEVVPEVKYSQRRSSVVARRRGSEAGSPWGSRRSLPTSPSRSTTIVS